MRASIFRYRMRASIFRCRMRASIFRYRMRASIFRCRMRMLVLMRDAPAYARLLKYTQSTRQTPKVPNKHPTLPITQTRICLLKLHYTTPAHTCIFITHPCPLLPCSHLFTHPMPINRVSDVRCHETLIPRLAVPVSGNCILPSSTGISKLNPKLNPKTLNPKLYSPALYLETLNSSLRS